MRTRRSRIPLLLLFAAPLVSCLGPCSSEGRARELEPGVATRVVFDPEAVPPVFQVEVPPEATALRLSTTGASHDVVLYAMWEERPDPEAGRFGVASANVWLDEDVLIDVTDYYNLAPGTWYVTAALAPRAWYDDTDGDVSLDLTAELIVPEPVPLSPGVVAAAVLERERGLRAAFRVDLPAGFAASRAEIRLEAYSPAADVELVAGPSREGLVWWQPYGTSWTTLNYERLNLGADQIDEDLILHVYAYPEEEALDRIPVQVLAALPEHGRLSLCPEPELPDVDATRPMATPLAATVAVYGPLGGGSGVVVSPRGHVISNAHVVVGVDDREITDDDLVTLAVGFSTDPSLPPAPTMGMELIDYREDLDLALMRITSRLDGTPLPAGMRFPHLEPRVRGAPPLGTPLFNIGYPMTGGSGSFVTLTLTQGILSGYAREYEGVLYKTDAQIHSGISGGACVDAEGRLLGIPAASIADANLAGGMGFVIPIELIPEAWLREIAGG